MSRRSLRFPVCVARGMVETSQGICNTWKRSRDPDFGHLSLRCLWDVWVEILGRQLKNWVWGFESADGGVKTPRAFWALSFAICPLPFLPVSCRQELLICYKSSFSFIRACYLMGSGAPAACRSKANKEARLVERKLLYFRCQQLGCVWWEGRLLSKGRLPPPDNQGTRVFMGRGRGLQV